MANIAAEKPTSQGLKWGDVLPVHPAAELLPLMPVEEQRDLGRKIKVNGLQVPVVIFVDAEGRRSLLDGRNRLGGMEYVGLPVLKDGALDPSLFQEVRDVDPVAYVLGANVYRRHLTSEGKRKVAANLLKMLPEKSDRQIAEMVGISHHTVANVRSELERCGQIAHVSNRVDATGKRRQPATKRKQAETDSAKTEAERQVVGTAGAEVIGKHGVEQPATEPPKTVVTTSQSAAMGTTGADVVQVENGVSASTGTNLAAAFDRFTPIEISKLLASISAGQRRRIEHALGHDGAANAEIAKLAREAKALLAHAEHNKDDIHKRLARIVNIADPDKKFHGSKGDTNTKIDTKLSSHAISMMQH